MSMVSLSFLEYDSMRIDGNQGKDGAFARNQVVSAENRKSCQISVDFFDCLAVSPSPPPKSSQKQHRNYHNHNQIRQKHLRGNAVMGNRQRIQQRQHQHKHQRRFASSGIFSAAVIALSRRFARTTTSSSSERGNLDRSSR